MSFGRDTPGPKPDVTFQMAKPATHVALTSSTTRATPAIRSSSTAAEGVGNRPCLANGVADVAATLSSGAPVSAILDNVYRPGGLPTRTHAASGSCRFNGDRCARQLDMD